MPSTSVFNFKSNDVRIVLGTSDEPLFCLPDVCKALDIPRTSDLLQVARDVVKNDTLKRRGALNPIGVHKIRIPTNGGEQQLTFIDEANLYRIVFRSTKPEAINFQNWVFQDVLPSIRKTGSYHARQSAFDELNRLHMKAKVQKEKGTFHGKGLNEHKGEMHSLKAQITVCESNLQIAFSGV